ncbi:MAG TPA: hypothetical protein VG891_08085 [Rhizomicrobium sp.]|nr:hypothetical protein [Rhizomicrobium sp.]
MRKSALLLSFAFAISAFQASAESIQSVGLSKLETKDLLLLYYDPLQTYLTPYAAQAYENSFQFQRKTFGWTPWDRPSVQLRDLSDSGQAVVRATPNNALFIDVAPISVSFETFSPGERFYTLMNHELVHIATMDVYNDEDAWWRSFFHGKPLPATDHPETILYNYLATPRANVPRWYLEGSAVFMETWMGGGLGRAQGGYDEMVFRAMVRDDAQFYDPLGLQSEGNTVDFQVGANDYLYGTRFFSYLALTYSPEKVIEWLKRGNGSDRYYSTQFRHVFGKSLDDAWQDWIAFEHRFQRANLALVQQYPATPVKRLSAEPLGSASRTFYDPKTDSLIGGFWYPGVFAHVGTLSLKDGHVRTLTNIKGPELYKVTSLAFDRDKGIVYYTTDNYAQRDLMQLDVSTGETKMLVRDGRVGDLAVNPADHTVWGIRHLNGLDTLVRLSGDRRIWNQIITFTYGHGLFDLDISRDGTMLSASVGEINGDQRIDVYRISDLLDGNLQAAATMKLGSAVPEGGAFSPDGRYLYATAYYTGVSNVYRLEIATGKVDAVSNAVTGFFRPIPMQDGSLIVYEFTGQGFQPVRIDPKPLDDLGTIKLLGTQVANEHPIVKSWAVGSPSKIPIDSMITGRGEYLPMDEMRLSATYPMIAGYKSHAAIGWYVLFEDPMQYDQLSANVSYSPAGNLKPGEVFHADISFHTLYWHVAYKHNGADFYDLFGPVERSRKGDSLVGGYKDILIYDPPRQLSFSADVGLYSGLDTLPGEQNVAAGAGSLASTEVGLAYTNLAGSLGSVDHEEGYQTSVSFLGDYQRGEFFPKVLATFDFGFMLPWKHSSAWLYTAAGAGSGDRQSSLRNFYFGSFGNNYVDDRSVKRYREYQSFPGFGIDALSARDFIRSVAEWNLPPVRFSDLGSPALYLSSIRPAVFAGVLASNPGASDSGHTESVGGQLDFNFTVAVRLPMTFSIGYAKGFGGGHGSRHEILASLKIL